MKDIPVFGWLAKGYSVAITVRDHIFLKKVALFLYNALSTSQEDKDKFRTKMEENPEYRRKVGENLILLLERHDHFDKSKLLGRVFSEYLSGRIDYNQFLRIANSIDRVSVADLSRLRKYKNIFDSYGGQPRESSINALNADICQSLNAAGLVTSGSAFEVSYCPNDVMKFLVKLIDSK